MDSSLVWTNQAYNNIKGRICFEAAENLYGKCIKTRKAYI